MDVIRSWVLQLGDVDTAPRTMETYESCVRDFEAWMNGTPLMSASEDDIREYLRDLKLDGFARNTRRLRLVVLKIFYKWLKTKDLIDVDPAREVIGPSLVMTPVDVLSQQQLKRILSVCQGKTHLDIRNKALFLVLLDTGIRRSECVNLDVASVHLPTTRGVTNALLDVTGKGARRQGPRLRTVVLGSRATVAVDRYLHAREKFRVCGNTDRLWLTFKGPLTIYGIKSICRRIGAEAGIPDLHPHMFRHTWADHAKRTMSLEDMMTNAGWESAQSAVPYGRSKAIERAHDAARRSSLGDML